MRHIPASYDHFWGSYVVVKLEHFWLIFRKSHLGRFADMDHRRKKISILREIIFSRNLFLGNVFDVPGLGNPKYWVIKMVFEVFTTLWNLWVDFFNIFEKIRIFRWNGDFELKYRSQNSFFCEIIFQIFFVDP